MSDEHVITLKSGRVVNAAFGLVSISKNFEVADGYDGHLDDCTRGEDIYEEGDPELWTAAEKIELADHMIGLWEKFKKEHTG